MHLSNRLNRIVNLPFPLYLKILIAVLFFSSLSNAQTPLQKLGRLKLVGNQLSSECGNPVQLRGLSTHGLQFHPSCAVNPAFKSASTDWGADIVRLAMYVEEGGYVNGTTSQANWKSSIDLKVKNIALAGMYCIIDWHVLTPGDPNADIDAAKEFWGYMSNAHKSDKHVLYEICNEPNGVSWSTVKTYANIIIPIIRANDPEAIIILGTPYFSSDLGSPTNDPITGVNAHNLMYTYHFYAASHMGRLDAFKNSLSNLPVFVTEWGASEASGTGNVDLSGSGQWVDAMSGNNPSKSKISWCYWSYSDDAGTSSTLTSGACAAATWTATTTVGAQIKNWTSAADNFTACANLATCKSPNLGSDVSLCGVSGGITLNSGLTVATNRTFTWKKDGVVQSGTGPTLAITQGGSYTVVVDSGTCETTDNIVVSATLPAVSMKSPVNLCNPVSATLDAGVTGTGITYAWTLDGAATGGNTKTLAVSQAGQYAVTVSSTGCASQTGSVTVTSSLPTVTGSVTSCQGAPTSITASGTGPFNWYTVASGGTSVFTGSVYMPAPVNTTTYYVEANAGAQSIFGPTDPGSAPWTVTDYSTVDKQLLYTASAAETLVSVDVSSASSQSITINVTDNASSVVAKTVTVTVPSGISTVAIGAVLTSGKTYRLDGVGTVGGLIFKNSSTTIYPQTIANVGTLTSNASYSMGWSLFYNVKVSTGSACARVPFTVTPQTCSGIEDEEIALSSMKIYPNPFEAAFTVNLGPNYGVAQVIEVRDMEGRLVDLRQGAAIASATTMGEHLPAGQYFVRVVTDNKVAVKPVVKLK